MTQRISITEARDAPTISWTPSEQLERMIDSQGLGSVLEMIREICYEKANHIAVEWQDMPLAKRWIAYAIRINNVVQAIR
jgi:hypothetical protein